MKKPFTVFGATLLLLTCFFLNACEISQNNDHDENESEDYTENESEDYTVNEDEWKAAFGLDLTYGFAENFKAVIQITIDGEKQQVETFVVDGNKLKLSSEVIGGSESDEQYYSFENNHYSIYVKRGTWEKHICSSVPSEVYETFSEPTFGDRYYQSFGDFSAFTFDEETRSYQCPFVNMGEMGGTATNVSIQFDNKKIAIIKYNIEEEHIHIDMSFTYGGQTVELPESY